MYYMAIGITRICVALLLSGCMNKPEKMDELSLEDKFSFDLEHQQDGENQAVNTNNKEVVKKAAKQLARRKTVRRNDVTPSSKQIKYKASTLELVNPGEVKAPFEAVVEYSGDSRDAAEANTKEIVLVPKEQRLSHLKLTMSGLPDLAVDGANTKEVGKGQKISSLNNGNVKVKVESTNGIMPDLNRMFN
jgi:hypothetical protein